VFLERAGLRLDGKEPHDPWIAQEGARVDREGGTGVAAAAGRDRGNYRSGDVSGHVLEHRVGERVDRREVLVEVTLGESGLGADVHDSDRGDSLRAEQFKAGLDQLLTALVATIGSADTAVWARYGRTR
jgi:hypothetical protein